MSEDICYFDENTLFKVRDTLMKYSGMSKHTAEALILALQNEGILFRERLPYINEDTSVRLEAAGSGSGSSDAGEPV